MQDLIQLLILRIYRNTSNNQSSQNSNGNSSMNVSPTSGPSTPSQTPTSPTDASTIPTTSGGGVNPALNPGVLSTKYFGQKRHSLTSIGGHKLSLAVQQQHRHSMELSGSNRFCDVALCLKIDTRKLWFL